MDELFNRTIPVCIKSSDRDERQEDIDVAVILSVSTTPVSRKELLVRLTDEQDPFFLYTLALGEDDFQSLKSQQGLLVDFTAFPKKFVDLLELCLSEASKDTPKFGLQFWPSGDKGLATLNVVEVNPFRHLNHLSLKLVAASDAYLKKYLAESLLSLKGECADLQQRLMATKSDLSAQLAQSEESLGSRIKELERLKSEWSTHSAAIRNECTAQLTAEKEKTLQLQCELQQKYEHERRELDQAHTTRLENLESRLKEFEKLNQELTDCKYRSEAATRELTAKLSSASEECVSNREEIKKLRRDNATLEASNHEQDKAIHQLKTRVAVLEQELHDKEQMAGRTTDLLNSAQEQKKSQQAELEQKAHRITKLEANLKTVSQDVKKGNEIIQKLQAELKASRSKLNMATAAATQQEKVLGEKELTMERQKQEIESLSRNLTLKQEEISKMEETLGTTRQQLDENRQLLKSNEEVIKWLNKQINEQAMGRGARLSADLPSSIRPSPPAMYAGITTGLSTFHPSTQLPFSSTPAERQVLGSLASQDNVRQQPIVFRGAAGAPRKGVIYTSPLSAKPPNTTSPPTMPSGVDDGGEPRLDPKYLPPQVTSQPPAPSVITPGVVRPPQNKGSPPAPPGRAAGPQNKGSPPAPPGRAAGPQTALLASYLPKT